MKAFFFVLLLLVYGIPVLVYGYKGLRLLQRMRRDTLMPPTEQRIVWLCVLNVMEPALTALWLVVVGAVLYRTNHSPFAAALLSSLFSNMFILIIFLIVFVFWPIPLLLLIAPLTKVRASHPQLRATARVLLRRGAGRCGFVLGIWGTIAFDVAGGWFFGSALFLIGYASMFVSLNHSLQDAEEYLCAPEYLLPAVSVGPEGVMIIEHAYRSKNRPKIG